MGNVVDLCDVFVYNLFRDIYYEMLSILDKYCMYYIKMNVN